MAANTIEDFLISIGYSVDDDSQKRFLNTIEDVSRRVTLFALALKSAAEIWNSKLLNMGEQIEKLHYTASLANTTIENLRAATYAASQVGIEAQDFQKTVVAFNAAIKFDNLGPYVESYIGPIQDLTGEEILLRFFEATKNLPIGEQARLFRKLHVPPEMLWLLREAGPKFRKEMQDAIEKEKRYRTDGRYGVVKAFVESWRRMRASTDLIWKKFEQQLAGPTAEQLDKFTKFLDDNSDRISKGLLVIATALLKLATALVMLVITAPEWMPIMIEWAKRIDDWGKSLGTATQNTIGWKAALVLLLGIFIGSRFRAATAAMSLLLAGFMAVLAYFGMPGKGDASTATPGVGGVTPGPTTGEPGTGPAGTPEGGGATPPAGDDTNTPAEPATPSAPAPAERPGIGERFKRFFRPKERVTPDEAAPPGGGGGGGQTPAQEAPVQAPEAQTTPPAPEPTGPPIPPSAEPTGPPMSAAQVRGIVGFRQVYQAAKRLGDPFPEVTAAQWAHESAWGSRPSGKFNYFGQKARAGEPGTSRMTWEVLHGRKVRMPQRFKDYPSLEAGVAEHVRKWASRYRGARTAAEAVGILKKRGYATDPAYVGKVLNVIENARRRGGMQGGGGSAGGGGASGSYRTPFGDLSGTGRLRKSAIEAPAVNSTSFTRKVETISTRRLQIDVHGVSDPSATAALINNHVKSDHNELRESVKAETALDRYRQTADFLQKEGKPLGSSEGEAVKQGWDGGENFEGAERDTTNSQLQFLRGRRERSLGPDGEGESV